MIRRAIAALFFVSSAANAADAKDGAHGRVDGDMAVEIGAGGDFGPRAPRAVGDLRFRYLSMAGLFGTYEWDRALATGIELRPLFLAKWFTGRYSGNAYLDLALDSIGLEIGAAFLQPGGRRLEGKPGLQAGLGFEIPFFPNATGPFVAFHGGVRWSAGALSAGPLVTADDRSLFLNIVVAWQQVFGTHVVDMGDRAP